MCVLVVLAAAASADEPEQLDAEFLEYLANLEGDDDDWTLVAQAEEARSPSRKDAESKTASPSKRADEPAVDER